MKEHYILGEDARLTIGLATDAIPLYYDNKEVDIPNKMICFIFKTDDHQTFRLFLDKKQAKGIRKALKMYIKNISGEDRHG